MPERARKAREMYESLDGVRKQLKLANTLIKRVDDKRRKSDLLDQYEQAQVPITRVVNAGHKFVYADLDSYLKVAQERVEKLMSNITNRAP